VHPTIFSEAEDALQDTKHRTKATGGRSLPWQMLAPVTTPNSFSKTLCIAILETGMARYPEMEVGICDWKGTDWKKCTKCMVCQEQKIRGEHLVFFFYISL
jgi:hypothetical protein